MSIYEKLFNIQQELKAPKNQRNIFGGYSYRSCEDILEAVKPLLKEHKCILLLEDKAVSETFSSDDKEKRDREGNIIEKEYNPRVYIEATATLIDIEEKDLSELTELDVKEGKSKGVISNVAYAREEAIKKGMDGSQITGASSSYARKYALNGLFAIDDNKDSDATNTGDNTTKQIAAQKQEYKCEQCGKEFTDITTKDNVFYKASVLYANSKKKFGKALCVDCAKAKEGEQQ